MSDYPMLISNKLHSFRNFLMQSNGFYLVYALYFIVYLPYNILFCEIRPRLNNWKGIEGEDRV